MRGLRTGSKFLTGITDVPRLSFHLALSLLTTTLLAPQCFSSSSLWIFLSIFWSVYFFFFCLIIIFFQRFLELLHKFSVTFTFLKYLSLWINIQKCINIFTKWIPAQKAIVLSHELIIIITRGKTVTSQQGDLAVTIFTTRSKSTSPLCASYTGH